MKSVEKKAAALVSEIIKLDTHEQISAINLARRLIHEISPFKTEPVDFVEWVYSEAVSANDYNPNSVAPPEMELLRHSINNDGYTQPVVTWVDNSEREVIDGFHRTRVCKEFQDVRVRVMGYLPVVTINDSNTDRNDRIASTIRHNRARGKHKVDAMSDIVLELKNRNWKNERIARELGMDEDEVLRLCQITGLSDLFSDGDFSQAWEADGSSVDDFEPIDDTVLGEDSATVRTVNTNDDGRIFHTHDKWECQKAGFYKSTFDGSTKKECELAYAAFLSEDQRFKNALNGVVTEWKHSCEHYLTNRALNRIAWLGQAAMCYATGVPAEFRGGYNLLSEEQQNHADEIAFEYLNKWLTSNGYEAVEIQEARTERQSVLY